MKAAVRKTRDKVTKKELTDFSSPDSGIEFIENYKKIMESPFHKAQKMSNIGYLAAEIELTMTWTRRLKFLQYMKDVPEVTSVPVPDPVFVMGLPRSGTTFLHRLLSLDPKIRAPLLWELLNPVPSKTPAKLNTPELQDKDREMRKEHIRKLIDKRRQMGDNALAHIHEVGHDLPEECLMAMTDEVPLHLQMMYSDYMQAELFLKIDTTNCYRYYRKMLQLLSFQVGQQTDPKRWMLKCPMHLFYPKQIAAAFPDAKLIWTHRHPVSSVVSMASLLKAVHSIYFDKEGRNDKVLGRQIKKVTEELLLQVPLDIKESGLPCCEITYNGLVKDPMGTVRTIYAFYKWEFSKEYEAILTEYLRKNAEDRERVKLMGRSGSGHALHVYDPAEFGLTEKELCEGKLKQYVDAHNVPMSKN